LRTVEETVSKNLVQVRHSLKSALMPDVSAVNTENSKEI